MRLLDSPCLRIFPTALLVASACGSTDGGVDGPPPGDGSNQPITEEADQCGASVAAGAGDAWTAMPLLNDPTPPSNPILHIGTDIVTGIHFATPDKGVIVSQDDGLMNTRGGAVFKANASAVTAVAFTGNDTGLHHAGTIDFTGVERTPTGFIAMAYASDVIASDDGGDTFTIKGNGADSRFSIDRVLALRVTASGTTLIHDNGVIATASSAPGTTAAYQDVWSSNQSHAMCPQGPKSSTTPTTRTSVYVSPGRTRIAYTAAPGGTPTVCRSIDGGASFTAHAIGATGAAQPTGVMFPTQKIGIAWYGASGSLAYIRRTADAGATWTAVALPGALATHNVELPGGYFAPDCMHAWLAGYDNTTSRAVLLQSSDAGASWIEVAGVADAVAAVNGDKMYSVFALDTAHVWAGGAKGVVVHN